MAGHGAAVSSGRAIVRRSGIWAVALGTVLGLGALQHSSWNDRVLFFTIRFLFIASLVFILEPRSIVWKEGVAAGRGALTSLSPRDRKRSLKTAMRAIGERRISIDPSAASAEREISAAWRRPLPFERAAFVVPCFWVGFALLRSAYRLIDGRIARAGSGLLLLVFPLLALVGLAVARKRQMSATIVCDMFCDSSRTAHPSTETEAQ